MRICYLLPVVLLLSEPALAGTSKGSAPPAGHPNIIFLLADDMGYGDPGCYNPASKIPTPNMDRLAAQGMRFTDAHSPSAVCTPTRYGVLTGRYAWRTFLRRGVLRGYSPCMIDEARITVASLLKANGYATACIGKWHLGLGRAARTDYDKPLRPGPNALGFEDFYGIAASLDMPPYVYIKNERPETPATQTIAASRSRRDGGPGFWRAGAIGPGFRHIDVLPTVTKEAVAFIERQASESPDRPFFLYFPLTAPHKPWLPTQRFTGKSEAGPYGDFTVQVDWTVGQVVQTVDRLGLADGTLIVVTSDNGARWTATDKKKYDHLANGNLRGQKADIWEGGHRVPLIARWPDRIRAGSTRDATVCLTDLLATAAEIVGAKLPADAGEDSFSMLGALLGTPPAGPVRDAIVHQSGGGLLAIRQGAWKLIFGRGSGGNTAPRKVDPQPGEPAGQLYNLDDDPAESINRYADHPEIVKRLSTLFDKYEREQRSRPAAD